MASLAFDRQYVMGLAVDADEYRCSPADVFYLVDKFINANPSHVGIEAFSFDTSEHVRVFDVLLAVRLTERGASTVSKSVS